MKNLLWQQFLNHFWHILALSVLCAQGHATSVVTRWSILWINASRVTFLMLAISISATILHVFQVVRCIVVLSNQWTSQGTRKPWWTYESERSLLANVHRVRQLRSPKKSHAYYSKEKLDIKIWAIYFSCNVYTSFQWQHAHTLLYCQS